MSTLDAHTTARRVPRATTTDAGAAAGARTPAPADPAGGIPASPHLFLTGPTYVRPEILAAMMRPMIGHRGPDFAELYRSVRRKLLAYAETGATALVATGSATSLLEAAVRSLVPERSLHAVCGSFSRRWEEIARLNGRSTGVVEAPLGHPITPEALARALSSARYDAVCVTHSETSTGVLSDLAGIAEVMRLHPDVLLLVDAVSSFAAVPIDVDGLGIDLLVTGTQKALALPPGLAIAFASPRALERAHAARHAGWYLDLARLADAAAADGTPATPALPLFFALDRQLDDLLIETAPRRFARHRRMAAATEALCARAGLDVFPLVGYRSPTLTVALTPDVDAERVRAGARARGWILGSGYGELKGRSFRIGHMGDHTEEELAELFAVLEDVLAELRA